MDTQDYKIKTLQSKRDIDARDFILFFWNHKFIVITITLLFTIGAILISSFLISPSYTTTFTIATDVPKTYKTKYGEFPSPISKSIDYVNLIKSNEVIEDTISDMGYNIEDVTFESMSTRITIGEVDPSQSVFPITVTGSDPYEIVDLANTLYSSFIDHVDLIIKDRAINHFYNDYAIRLDSDKDSLESTNDLLVRYEELIATTSAIVDQEELLKVISDTNDYIFLHDALNPNYIALQTDIFETKKAIETITSRIKSNTVLLEELSKEKEALNSFYLQDDNETFDTDLISTSNSFIISEPVVPNDKAGPDVRIYTLIGGFGGFALSLFLVFLKGYIKKEI